MIQLSAATEIVLFSCCKKRPELHKKFTVIKTFLLSLQCNAAKVLFVFNADLKEQEHLRRWEVGHKE